MKKKRMIAIFLAFALVFVGCTQTAPTQEPKESSESVEAKVSKEPEAVKKGTLIVKVNPEIKVHYDESGKVVSLEGENEDGKDILKEIKDVTNKEVKDVVKTLLKKIGEKGYLVEEVKGKEKEIILEVEKGSLIPDDDFLEDIVDEVEDYIESKAWIKNDDDTMPIIQLKSDDKTETIRVKEDDLDDDMDDDKDDTKAVVPVKTNSDDDDQDDYDDDYDDDQDDYDDDYDDDQDDYDDDYDDDQDDYDDDYDDDQDDYDDDYDDDQDDYDDDYDDDDDDDD